MLKVSNTFGRTDSQGALFAVVPASTSLAVGQMAVYAGQSAGKNAGYVLKRMEDAVWTLLDRIRNVSKGQVSVRVEVYADESEAVFNNGLGLTADTVVAGAAFVVPDADLAQSTQLLAGGFKQLLEVAREGMNQGGAPGIRP